MLPSTYSSTYTMFFGYTESRVLGETEEVLCGGAWSGRCGRHRCEIVALGLRDMRGRGVDLTMTRMQCG